MYTVVVADSDKLSLEFFQKLKIDDDMTFKGVSSSRELLAEIASGGSPEILITEALLPDISISDLLRTLGLECPRTLIVVITKDDSKRTSERVRMHATPIFYFAPKPLSEEEMRHVLQDAVFVLKETRAKAG